VSPDAVTACGLVVLLAALRIAYCCVPPRRGGQTRNPSEPTPMTTDSPADLPAAVRREHLTTLGKVQAEMILMGLGRYAPELTRRVRRLETYLPDPAAIDFDALPADYTATRAMRKTGLAAVVTAVTEVVRKAFGRRAGAEA